MNKTSDGQKPQTKEESLLWGGLRGYASNCFCVMETGLETMQSCLRAEAPAVNERMAPLLQSTMEEMRRMERCIMNLAEVLALREDGVQPMMELLPLSALWEQGCQALREEMAQRGSRASLMLPQPLSQPLYALGDRGLFDVVLANLFSNALQFAGEAGSLQAWTEQTPTGIRLVLQNSGQSLLPRQMAEAQKKERRLESLQQGRLEGMGLYIAAQYCRLMGWTLEGQGLQTGTQVAICVPPLPAGQELLPPAELGSRDAERLRSRLRLQRELDAVLGMGRLPSAQP